MTTQTYNFIFSSQEATENFAQNLYPLLAKKAQEEVVLIYLLGDLGAGKSTFSRAFIRASGYQGNIPSPTYSIQESYKTDTVSLHHLDLYRLGDFSELEMLGFFDNLVAGNLLLIEWPQLLIGQYESTLTFEFKHTKSAESRTLTISATSPSEELHLFLKNLESKYC